MKSEAIVFPKMKKEKNKPTKEKDSFDIAIEKFRHFYDRWKEAAAIKKDDSIGLSIVKIGIRVAGIIFFIAISPFLIIGLLFGLFAAF